MGQFSWSRSLPAGVQSRPMRHALLLRSVARLLGDQDPLIDAAYMWRRHPHMIWYGAAAFVAMVVVAAGVGWDEWSSRVSLGAVAAAVAVYATTDYRILARTSNHLVLLTASKIRQVAKAVIQTYPSGSAIDLTDGNMLATSWQFDGELYTVPKSSERSMRSIATLE